MVEGLRHSTARAAPDRRRRVGRPASGGGVAAIVFAAALAVLVVPAWVLYDWDATPESKAFVSTPQFVIWLLILCGQAAIWVGAGWFVFTTVRRRVRDLRRRRLLGGAAITTVVISATALVLVTVAFNFGPRLALADDLTPAQIPSGDAWPLSRHETKMPALAAVAFLIGFVAVAGMWLTTIGFHDLARRRRPTAPGVKRFVALRMELTTLLAVAGALIGLATLSSGALREAVLAANDASPYRERTVACLATRSSTPPADVRVGLANLISAYPECRQLPFDQRYVVAYGLLFTGVLGIAFIPCFVGMRDAGTRLRDATFPLPSPRDPAFFDMVERRRALDDVLQTNLSASATFKAGVAIATPLAASLVSTLVPT